MRLTSVTQPYSPEIPRSCLCIRSFSFLVLNSIAWHGCTAVSVTVHTLKDILLVSRFWQLRIKRLPRIVYSFLSISHFSDMNAQVCDCLVTGSLCALVIGSLCALLLLLFKNFPSDFADGRDHFIFPPTTYEWLSFSAPLTAFGVVTSFYFGCSNRCFVVSHVTLICIFTVSDVELFMCFFSICLSFSVKDLFMLFPIF